ncbi:uncharacterized protein LOC142104731 [Mixophyes fleayi]|uniref:uncharacterized protein LOC142104731 n=1 Tax=Mixophyes fleayi TaxID=3061075 RepID=UPI003F4E1937
MIGSAAVQGALVKEENTVSPFAHQERDNGVTGSLFIPAGEEIRTTYPASFGAEATVLGTEPPLFKFTYVEAPVLPTLPSFYYAHDVEAFLSQRAFYSPENYFAGQMVDTTPGEGAAYSPGQPSSPRPFLLQDRDALNLESSKAPTTFCRELGASNLGASNLGASNLGASSNLETEDSTESSSEQEEGYVICTTDLLSASNRPRLLPSHIKMYVTIFPKLGQSENTCSTSGSRSQHTSPQDSQSLVLKTKHTSKAESNLCNQTFREQKTHSPLRSLDMGNVHPKKRFLQQYLHSQTLETTASTNVVKKSNDL